MSIGIWHIFGILAVLVAIAVVSVLSGRQVKSAADFTTGGGRAGRWMVVGTILGSLVSGQATVGTAQLAFTYGLSAWWFTLGSGIGCLLLAIGYAVPLRHSGKMTLLQVISQEYGGAVGYVGSVLSSIGIFISVIAQVVSAVALITTLFPVSPLVAAAISIALMSLYVIFGGVWGAGMGGVLKLLLLYLAALVGCAISLWVTGGFGELLGALERLLTGTGLGGLSGIASQADVAGRYYSLVARGTAKDIGSGLSLTLGVLSTQIYAQGTWSAKSDPEARKGALLSACLIPPIGAACIVVGLFMRTQYITTAELSALAAAGQAIPAGLRELASTAQAFPAFVVNHMPPLLGGVVLGTLFLTVVGGGAGLSLGVATIVVNDIIKKVTDKLTDANKSLLVTRVTIVCVLAAAAVITQVVSGTMINDMGFLSMGLRACVIFLPLTCVLYLPGRVNPKMILAGEIAAPIAVLAANFMKLSIDPLFVGMGISLLFCAVGLATRKKTL